MVDARRDVGDLGCYIKVIEGCQQLDKETRVFGLPSDFKEGVIFSTYATLVSSVQKGKSINSSKQTRLQQLVDWCGGPSFEGCLIFDECHKAKNFVPGKDNASTKVALAVAHIQRLLPKARVVYCSATGVSDVKNMAFMERMGLWGDGAPFRSFEQFIDTVQKKGLGVAEMLAMEMKSSGMYVSRGLSYIQAEFATVEIELTKDQVKMFDTAAHVWNELRVALESAISRTRSSNNRVWSTFWGAHQRFFKQLCLGIKVPAVVREAKAVLDAGYCVVIGLQTTGEASMESEALSSKGPIKDFISLCREILTRFIQQQFPVMIEGERLPDEGPEDSWSSTARDMLLAFAQQIPLPNSPLDEIIDQLGGPDNVAEMTGRRARIVRSGPNGEPKYELRDDKSCFLESLNVHERNQFMNGPKRVAIISDAASTGISLHADQRVSNQCRRVHITLELPWSADKAVQQLGRSHRSNQSSGPLYKLMTTTLGGERRFAATVARRLQSLGALTKGDRRAATGADLDEFNFDTPYGRTALRTMYSCICKQEMVPGVAFSVVSQGKYDTFTAFNDEMLECLNRMCVLEMDVLRNRPKVKDAIASDVGRFLNRILGLSVGPQQLIFNYFVRCLDAQVLYAKKEGKYNEGLVDVHASSVEMLGEPRRVFKDVTNNHNPTKHVILKVDRGMSWEAALKRLENHSGKDNGFYRAKREMFGRKFLILVTQKEGSAHSVNIARPNTGVSNFDEDRTDLFSKYKLITQEDAEAEWREQYKYSEERCIHGPHCKTGAACTVGSRCYHIHLLCGGIVTLMTVLETTIGRYGPRLNLSKAESVLRVVRAQLNTGERVVGIRYPEMLIPLVEQMLLEQRTIERMQKQQSTSVNGTGGPLATPAPALQKQIELEDVTPVNPKSLKKALTPPVTLKNFFKVVPKPLEGANSPSEQETQGRNQSRPEAGKSACKDSTKKSSTQRQVNKAGKAKGQLNPSSQECSKRDDEVVVKNTVINYAPESSDPVGDFVSEPVTKSRENNAKRKGCKREISEAEIEGGKPAKRSKRGKKSSAEGNQDLKAKVEAAKQEKSKKQGNLMAAFAKAETKVENKTKECPICGKHFKPTDLNKEINDHIDNCLIE